MRVLKFGGTSGGTVRSLTNVKAIVEARQESLIVVVSALGGITDMLINTAHKALAGFDECADDIAVIARRHHDIIDVLVPEDMRGNVSSDIDRMLAELTDIYRGVSLIKDLSAKTLDIIVSYGERMSSYIISHVIANARLYDSRGFIKTVRRSGKDVLDDVVSKKLIVETFAGHESHVAIVPGFISSDADARITNLGRGGSDYTAAILAADLGADVLEIWTDVDGFMTADPRIIPNAYVI
ncbi:MAG: bifunctional aspartate kinase/homoserine dehydrogenase I, partial [Muribaculaceae bacterium]|nr:bifunctional aspartate kinase/homoserine dehydrogenase I [Muribaculaceae bacterium]